MFKLGAIFTFSDFGSRMIGGVQSKIDSLSGAIDKQKTKLDALKMGFQGLTTVGAGLTAMGGAVIGGMSLIGKQAIDTGSFFEKSQMKLAVVLKSQQKATEMMKWVSDKAAQTPFELPGVLEAAVNLESMGIKTKDVFNTIGDAAAIMNIPVEEAAFGFAAIAKGRTEFLERFKVPLSDITKKMNELAGSTNKYKNMQQDLGLSTKAFMTIMQERYKGGMEKLAKTLEGRLSNVSDTWTRFKLKIAEGGVFEFVKEKISAFVDYLAKLESQGSFKVFGEALAGGIKIVLDLLIVVIKPLGDFINLLAEIGKTNPGLLKTIVAFTTFAAIGAAIVGPLLMAAGGIGFLITSISSAWPILTAMGPIIAGFAGTLVSFIPIVLGVAAAFGVLFLMWKNNFGGIRNIVGGFIGFVIKKFEEFKLFVYGAIQPILPDMIKGWQNFITIAKAIFSSLAPAVTSALTMIMAIVKPTFTFIVNFIMNAFTIIMGAVKILTGIFTLNFDLVRSGVVDILSGLVGQILNILTFLGVYIGNFFLNMINGLIGIIDSGITLINKMLPKEAKIPIIPIIKPIEMPTVRARTEGSATAYVKPIKMESAVGKLATETVKSASKKEGAGNVDNSVKIDRIEIKANSVDTASIGSISNQLGKNIQVYKERKGKS